MSNNLEQKTDSDESMVYQIRIKGHLGDQWTDWFGGLTITLEDNDETLLTGAVVDQSALHGLLKKIRGLGMPLISVNRVEPDPVQTSQVKQEMNERIKTDLDEQTRSVIVKDELNQGKLGGIS